MSSEESKYRSHAELVSASHKTLKQVHGADYMSLRAQPSTGLSCTNCPNPKASPTITTTYTVTKIQCKVTTSDVITVSVSPTGIRDLYYNQVQAKLFPNPNNGTFTLAYDLKTNAKAKVLIMDVTGKMVYSSMVDNLNNRKQINTEYLQDGIYFIQLADDEKLLWTDKLIISK